MSSIFFSVQEKKEVKAKMNVIVSMGKRKFIGIEYGLNGKYRDIY
ncbi:hypothetical protein A33Q_3230 [Indibacter alkaliphilus LW1]|uniref:Uncharacterized protein n=1 Tax=Indibacter alkaliphilus (strain CCUG 57479 / KCTC 22604 / LW1) TaxID=1189612 RepID=S2E1A3_INDAL|nr:hypothetical protein A33Q_3230 [Indibacter alkaliphilus LW1]